MTVAAATPEFLTKRALLFEYQRYGTVSVIETTFYVILSMLNSREDVCQR